MKIAKQEVTYLDHCGSDLSVVNAARVSFHKQSDWDYEDSLETDPYLGERDVKLINYLAKHNHKSPFNHCFLSFRVKAPIFVARQLVKHEYLPWNEVSRRYVDEEPEFYFPEYWRKKADNVKQGSSSIEVEDVAKYALAVCDDTLSQYQLLLGRGVCAEQARMILPQNTMTEWIWSGTLFAFVKMLKLRLDSHTQQETREVAQLIAPYIEQHFPVSYKALMEHAQI